MNVIPVNYVYYKQPTIIFFQIGYNHGNGINKTLSIISVMLFLQQKTKNISCHKMLFNVRTINQLDHYPSKAIYHTKGRQQQLH